MRKVCSSVWEATTSLRHKSNPVMQEVGARTRAVAYAFTSRFFSQVDEAWTGATFLRSQDREWLGVVGGSSV